MDRPESANRIDVAMAAEIREVCRLLREDDGLRLVILTAAGEVFSTGRELLEQESADRDNLEAEAPASWLQGMRVASDLAALPVPVVVAINGDVTDHGLELALSGDIRLSVPGARFGFSPLSTGAFPWDGGTQRLPRLLGPSWARDMLLTGRKLTAAEALSTGLVNRVVEGLGTLMEETHEVAEQIAAGSPLGARYAKEAISGGVDLTLDQGLRLEADLNVILQSTKDRAEGIRSFLERRPPDFGGG